MSIPVIAPDPFKTKTPLTPRGMATYNTIAARLATLKPPIFIAEYIAGREEWDPKKGTRQIFSTLEAKDSTLDGIKFIAADPPKLVRAFESAQDKWGHRALTSMREDPEHWALKASFGATSGTGWREVWHAAPYSPPATVLPEPGTSDNVMRMRFGNAGSSIRFTALHCAVHEIGAGSSIHIDESGFVLALPQGVALTPNLYDHIMNELLVKTTFPDWLSGKMSNETAACLVKETFRRIAIHFPNAANGYAGLNQKINGIRQPRGLANGLWTAARILTPIGATVDVYDTDLFKVQVTGTILNGDRAITLTIGGAW
jgi:hypothetical protein